jgi:hypothetical protein
MFFPSSNTKGASSIFEYIKEPTIIINNNIETFFETE